MKYGVSIPFTTFDLDPGEIARVAEDLAFESMWFPEHTHVPTETAATAALKREHTIWDPFIACAMAAAVTSELRVGTGVCLVPQHDPITTAKTVATLDRLSNGRFLFGIGAGWNAPEVRNHGTDYRTRFSLMRERVLAMKAIWTQDDAAFQGRFVDFKDVTALPRPVQSPHPPIILGGDGDKTLARVAEYCDGWMPLARSGGVPNRLGRKMEDLRRRAGDHGRDPDSIRVSYFGAPSDPQVLDALVTMGVDRSIFVLESASQRETIESLRSLANRIRL